MPDHAHYRTRTAAFIAQVYRCDYCGMLPCQCPDRDAPLPGEPVGEWTEIGTTDGD